METNQAAPSDSFLRLPNVLSKTGLSRSSLYRLIASGDFPRHIKLSKRTSVWSEMEINQWIDDKKKEAL